MTNVQGGESRQSGTQTAPEIATYVEVEIFHSRLKKSKTFKGCMPYFQKKKKTGGKRKSGSEKVGRIFGCWGLDKVSWAGNFLYRAGRKMKYIIQYPVTPSPLPICT